MNAIDLFAGAGGALRQAGAPKMPPASAQHDMAQMLLAMDWAQRGEAVFHGSREQCAVFAEMLIAAKREQAAAQGVAARPTEVVS